MQNPNIGIILIVVLVILTLVIFLVVRNRKDRKKLFPPEGTDDPVEKERRDQHRQRDTP